MIRKQVVIVGKPNVGKSQLFNRLSGERHSIVFSEPGVTRDRVSLEVSWFGKKFMLTDTGGYTNFEYKFQEEINRQVEIALKEADLVLFLISRKDGITEEDIYLSKLLKKYRISPIILVANKCDWKSLDDWDEYQLGFGQALSISAEHGINTGVLLENIFHKLGIESDIEDHSNSTNSELLKLTIIGRPNVGKSSIVNALLKEDRVIISNIPGTTRDAIDLNFEFLGNKYTLIDTPGIRRHSSIYKDEKEKLSILRAQKSIARANMICFVLDISEDLCELDERIGGLIYKANIPSVIVVNKCDLVRENFEKIRKEFEIQIRNKFKFLKWSPIVFVSAKENKKLFAIFKKIQLIREEVKKKIPLYLLNEFQNKISFLYSVPSVKGRKISLFSLRQVEGQVPTFLFLCNNPDYLHFSYSRLIENQIRTCFGYKNCPITVIYKKNF